MLGYGMVEMKHHLAWNLFGAVLAACFLAGGALADDEDYIDNWLGNIRLELATPELPEPVPLPAGEAGEPLSERLRQAWEGSLSKTCELIRQGFKQSGSVREWRSCDLVATGELRGHVPNPSLFPNRLDLKYVVAGNRIRFVAPTPTLLGNWADPLVQAEFRVVIRLTLLFNARLDLDRPPAGGPILLSGHIGFEGARFTSSWDGIPVASGEIAASLRDAEARLNARMESFPSEMLPVKAMNEEIYNKAIALRKQFETDENQTPYLRLRTLLRENDFVILFSRGTRPAVALTMCTCTSLCRQRIGCTCAGAGILQDNEQILLQRLISSVWKGSGRSEAGSWSVNGDALGAIGGEDVTVRICSENQWGMNCGGPITFRYQDIGLCNGSYDPTPTPFCPPGLRPCPGHGCLAPSMECPAVR